MKMRKKNFLICFIGIDGSGKTTLAKMLVDAMNKESIKCEYVWCGWRQFETFLLKNMARVIKSLRRHSHRKHDIEPDITGEIHNSFYRYLILMDYVFSSLPKVSIPLALGRNIVCDRYVYDVIGGLLENHPLMGKVALNLLPKPDLIFLVNLPEEIAYQRKDDIPSVDYLKKKRAVYLRMEKKFKMTIIDGSKELADLKNVILPEAMKLA